MSRRLHLSTVSALAALLPGMLFAADPPAAVNAAAAKVRVVVGHRGSCADRPDNTLAGVQRAIEVGAGAAEVDVRWTSDRALVCLHDATLDRTTTGRGPVGTLSLAEVKKLDAGAKFDERFRGERVPTLEEVLTLAKGKIRVMLDLKESGDDYDRQVAAAVRKHGEPDRIVVGVRSVEQTKKFRELLPDATLIGLVPNLEQIESFSEAGATVIRLWPKELADPAAAARVRKLKRELLVGAGLGTPEEVRPLLVVQPEWLSSDDPRKLLETLAALRKHPE